VTGGSREVFTHTYPGTGDTVHRKSRWDLHQATDHGYAFLSSDTGRNGNARSLILSVDARLTYLC